MILRPAAFAATLVLLALAASPGTAATTPTAATTEPVRHETLTLVDPSRPTDDPGGTRGAPSRTLVTEVYVPRGKGPFPVVLLAHGNHGNPGKLSQLLEAWAAAGYVAAAPAFPLTNDLSGGPSILVDYRNQPGDLEFVLDELLARSRRKTGFLAGRIDPRHIGAAGFSLGGATVYGYAFNGAYRFRGPVMFVHLRNDPIVSYDNSTAAYAESTTPKLLMTLEQGVHPEPFENIPSVHDEAVIAATTKFWDVYLRGEGTIRAIVRAGADPGLSTVVAKP